MEELWVEPISRRAGLNRAKSGNTMERSDGSVEKV